jgi:hypothetical protein
MRKYQGYEIPDGMELSKETKKVLRWLKTKGFVVAVKDDGPWGSLCFDQISKIASYVGFDVCLMQHSSTLIAYDTSFCKTKVIKV